MASRDWKNYNKNQGAINLSGFVTIFERSNSPVVPGELERVMNRLSHRGPDGCEIYQSEKIAMGHWHFWTTPEEIGEHQPLRLNDLPFRIVLDGRLDNRENLFSELGSTLPNNGSLSDAALILYAYGKWGDNCFSHFIGEFALVIFDENKNEVICGRDQLGDRTLFYALDGTRLVIASEPWAVAGASKIKPGINESAVAHYFALSATEDGQTLFAGIYELLPAYMMVTNASSHHISRYWQPDLIKHSHGKSDDEYAEEFRSLLEESIRCRLRSITPVGVLMSGGLDSTSVACLAARMLTPKPLTTISYVFDELSDCDEREYIDAVKEQWDIRSIQIPCDDAWPFKGLEKWPHNPNQPDGNLYRFLKDRAYKRAYSEGLRVLLTGGFGDHLYGAGDNWLVDMFEDGLFLGAWKELNLSIRHVGLHKTLQAEFSRRAFRRLINITPGGRYLHRGRGSLAWLTPLSMAYLSTRGKDTDPALKRYSNLLGKTAADSSSKEIFYSNQHSLELRHPYRDRRLVEFVLTLPAYQLYRYGLYKHILRVAMKGILPEIVRVRSRPTFIISLYSRGIERERSRLQTCFLDSDTAWGVYVDRDWLLKHWNIDITPETDGPQALVPWLSISYAAWIKKLISSN